MLATVDRVGASLDRLITHKAEVAHSSRLQLEPRNPASGIAAESEGTIIRIFEGLSKHGSQLLRPFIVKVEPEFAFTYGKAVSGIEFGAEIFTGVSRQLILV